MRIVISDTAHIWNHENPALRQFREIVLVVCLEGRRVSDQYECFISPYRRHGGLGIDKFGVESLRYRALESVASELNQNLGYHDQILFLTDGNPESLYPFYVIKDRNEFNRLHLCTVSPWKFENGRRKEAHKELLSDLSQLESVLYIDSNDYLIEPGQQDTVFMGELMRQLSDDYAALLPRILNGIQDMEEKSYFDLASKSYVPVGAGFEQIDLTKASDEVSTVNVPLYRQWCTLGYAMPQKKYPMEDDGTKEETERVHARIDGKKICNYLRQLRIGLARANGIEFYSEECPSIGACGGTCAKCDQEAAYLRDRLADIPESEKVIPQSRLTGWELGTVEK